jgi:uncharacterized SAM-binding protein YcdF (DUF218 family)
MIDVVWFVFSPGGIVASVFLGLVWLLLRTLRSTPASTATPGRQIRAPLFYLLTVTILYGLSGTSAVTHAGARLLAYGYQPFFVQNLSPGRHAIVLLGSGSYVARDWTGARLPLLDRASAERVIEAVRVFQLTDPEWIISSGGLIASSPSTEANGQTMRDGLVRLGVPASRVQVETESRTTREQATIVGRMLRSLSINEAILVTSEAHMRRALASFRAVGVNAVPAVARNPFHGPNRAARWLPTSEGFAEGAFVAHETLGLSYYWLRGWARF